MRKSLVTLFAFLVFAVPVLAAATTSVVKNNLRVLGNLVVSGTQTFTGNTTVSGNLAVTGNTTHTGTLLQTGVATFTAAPVLTAAAVTANGDTISIQDLGNANIVQSEGAQTINGAKTFGTPLTVASVNNAIESHVFNVPVVNGTIADGTTYTCLIAPGRAGTITKLSIAAAVVPVGGTNTVTISKNGVQTLLSAANFDPTTIGAAHTSQALTLTATGADLTFVATDVIKIVWVAGTQSTDGIAPAVSAEMNFTDY